MISSDQEATVRDALQRGPMAAYSTHRERVERFLLYLLVIIVTVFGLVLISVRATANGTEAALRLFCPAYQDVASLPLLPSSTSVGVALVADFRRAYMGAGCSDTYGHLPPADPRVAEYLRTHP